MNFLGKWHGNSGRPVLAGMYIENVLLLWVLFMFILFLFFILQDHIIIELTKTGLKKVTDEGEEPVTEEDPFLVVNPNYVLED